MSDYVEQRRRMVERQLRRRGVGDERVLEAMATIPRELFVEPRLRRRAYADGALPIGAAQTISQPWVVATIAASLALEGEETVLEIGTGSGYSTAILALLAARVITIERIESLAVEARTRLAELEIENVEVRVGDGTRGAADAGPYEGIAVHAAAPAPPRSLLEQLADGGRLVAPVNDGGADMLTVFVRDGDRVSSRAIAPCRFVPLLGEEGYGGS